MDVYDRSWDSKQSQKRPIPREVFVVLEYDGNAYQEALHRTEMSLEKARAALLTNSTDEKLQKNVDNAAKRLNRERFYNSRLFAIDVGLTPGLLREKYRDSKRFIIAKGLAVPRIPYDKNKKITGYLKRLSIGAIHVPLKHRQILDTLLDRGKSRQTTSESPRYWVELGYGGRWEPWIMSVRQM